MGRRKLTVPMVVINGRAIDQIIIDDHVDKHVDVTSDTIWRLVKALDGVEQRPDDVKAPYEYYVSLIELEKQYRLVWLLEDFKTYIGIITAYRDNRRK